MVIILRHVLIYTYTIPIFTRYYIIGSENDVHVFSCSSYCIAWEINYRKKQTTNEYILQSQYN